MKIISMSIKEHTLTDSYKPKFREYDYVEEFDFENETDLEHLYEKVNLYVHTYYTYNQNIRKGTKFESASAIFLDFDGKDQHNDSTVDEFLNSSFAGRYNWFLYTSKSHKDGLVDCYHVILPLTEDILDINDLKETYEFVFEEIKDSGLRCDFKVRDGARLIFPSLNSSMCADEHFDNFQFEYHYGGEYLEPVYSDREFCEISDDNEFDIGINQNTCSVDDSDGIIDDYLLAFKGMSRIAQFRYAKSIMKFVNNRNRRSGFTKLDYNTWIGIGFGLYKVFGKKYGMTLFKILSSGHPNDNDLSINDQFNFLCGDIGTIEDNIRMMIKVSSRLGYRHYIYFNYYFVSKQSFDRRTAFKIYRQMLRVLANENGFDGVGLSNIKIWNVSSKHAKTFVMEGDGRHIRVKFSRMVEIVSEIFKLPTHFITKPIRNGVIRKFINSDGKYYLDHYVYDKIRTFIDSSDEFVKVSELTSILQEAREIVPSTIYTEVSNKSIESTLMEQGVIVCKKRKRFKTGVGRQSKTVYAYQIDHDRINMMGGIENVMIC